MRTLRAHYPLRLLCRVLEVSRSGYYAWRHRRPSKRDQENARLEVAIQAAHVRTRQTYGPRLSSKPQKGEERFTAIISSAKKDEDHPRKAVVRACIHRGAKVVTIEGLSKRTSHNAPER